MPYMFSSSVTLSASVPGLGVRHRGRMRLCAAIRAGPRPAAGSVRGRCGELNGGRKRSSVWRKSRCHVLNQVCVGVDAFRPDGGRRDRPAVGVYGGDLHLVGFVVRLSNCWTEGGDSCPRRAICDQSPMSILLPLRAHDSAQVTMGQP